ncbi:glutathione S-transferase/GST-like protein [Roseiarcus fermentans]|uniref:Glutathione S-transferase/GST-like protein n=1 Tax=Roseiarcus fermentans TaxID=1473586 RepID=A0A366FJ95_9HYPH|nr:glutathione S-transferase N-terminal domain-containing protein [Roseiarcus fermentans]RBP13789.1 glutathione S-transferase/GST-like protein [Roseiarcus fermentans]
MIDLYAFATPNSVKVPVMLEEVGAAYRLIKVNIRAGEQKTPEFLALNPNGKVPVIVDPQGPHGAPVTITESAAILIYLGEKFGRLIPADPVGRIRMFEWMFFHASGLGPAFGQSGYFQKLAPTPAPLAIERFSTEARRTLAVLDRRLRDAEYLAGEYSVADIVNFGWIWRREFAGVDFSETPNVARWYASLEQRPAVSRAIAKLSA